LIGRKISSVLAVLRVAAFPQNNRVCIQDTSDGFIHRTEAKRKVINLSYFSPYSGFWRQIWSILINQSLCRNGPDPFFTN
jgi:hypothetical protein